MQHGGILYRVAMAQQSKKGDCNGDATPSDGALAAQVVPPAPPESKKV